LADSSPSRAVPFSVVLKVKFILLTTYAIARFIPSQVADVNPAPYKATLAPKRTGIKIFQPYPKSFERDQHSSPTLPENSHKVPT
jgi:hypothetical protein